LGELAGDLGSGHVPAFSYVIPDECRDEHGDPPFCVDSGGHASVVGTTFYPATATGAPLILAGDGGQGWHIVPGPNPSGGQDNAILGGIASAGGTLWAAGTYGTGGSRLTLLEHR
jgi:hypothetical protein